MTTKQQLEEIQKEISKLEEKKKKLLTSATPEIEVAEFLHEKLCHANHTDQCSWCYETDWDDKKSLKYAYKAIASKLLEEVRMYMSYGYVNRDVTDGCINLIDIITQSPYSVK